MNLAGVYLKCILWMKMRGTPKETIMLSYCLRDVGIRGVNHIVEEEKMTSRTNEYTIGYNWKFLWKCSLYLGNNNSYLR